jgi:hypothetical protein
LAEVVAAASKSWQESVAKPIADELESELGWKETFLQHGQVPHIPVCKDMDVYQPSWLAGLHSPECSGT